MKLKEYPQSLFTAYKLLALKPERLHAVQESLPIIVSLTSIPSRLSTVHLTIRSLLAQSHKPQRIVLWLNEKLRDQVPDTLTDRSSGRRGGEGAEARASLTKRHAGSKSR